MNRYRLSENWPDLPDDLKLGNPTGIGIDAYQDVFIFHRADRQWSSTDPIPSSYIASKTILKIDRHSGKIRDSWGDHFFIMPHGLTVDRNNNIWVTDLGRHQVFKFDHSGSLLLTVGEDMVPGQDQGHFNLPTAVAVTADGSFYVSDGYGNNRVVKFSANGNYILEWGRRGDKEGEFHLPHAIDLDDEENVYVADRENNRVQVFSATGKFLLQWSEKSFGKISCVGFDKWRKSFLITDYQVSPEDEVTGSGLVRFDARSGKPLRLETDTGKNCWYHNIAADDEGSIYITDILANRVQKWLKL